MTVGKLPPILRRLVSLLGRSAADETLPADLRRLGLPTKLPKGAGKIQDKKRGITIELARAGEDVVIVEIHLGAKYDGPLPFRLPSGCNDFTARKLLGKPSTRLKAKDGGPVWEIVLDEERGVMFSRSRGHFDWWSEHRFFLRA